MTTDALTLVELDPPKRGGNAFTDSQEFVAVWWKGHNEGIHWITVGMGDIEVARVKFTLGYPDPHPLLGPMPEGQLDILGLEVARSMRRQGIGRDTIALVRSTYPGPRMTALNDDAESAKFWDGIGWHRFESAHEVFRRSDRVTYAEH
ncbi:MAG: hypothetical protein LBE05_05785 [Microbacterium sp.]|jgi:hypothetical protein|nr:hypothetical protein [Microbacterium sp.]